MFVPLGQNLTGNRNPEFWRARFSFDEQVMSSLDLFGGERFTCWITHQIQQRTRCREGAPVLEQSLCVGQPRPTTSSSAVFSLCARTSNSSHRFRSIGRFARMPLLAAIEERRNFYGIIWTVRP